MPRVKLTEIKRSGRHRKSFGDIEGLAASMDALGLLQPVVVTKDRALVAGDRRLAAAQHLGWDEIDVVVVERPLDALEMLKAERDENTQRKSFTPLEEYGLYQEFLALEDPSLTARAKDEIAHIVTGMPGRRKTLDRIGEIYAALTDTSSSDRLKATAEEALGDIERTGIILDAYKRVVAAKRASDSRLPSARPWGQREQELRNAVESGRTVVANLREDNDLLEWARAKGVLIEIDRTTEWGNPFEIPYDGDREDVINNYREHYLPFKPSLRDRLPELRGKVLGCWCAPEACHGDVLAEEVELQADATR